MALTDVRLSWDSLVGRSDKLLNALTPAQLEYAARDASVTLRLYEVLKAKLETLRCSNELSHQTQLQGAWALRQIEARGISVDRSLLKTRLDELEEVKRVESDALEALGYIPKQKGCRAFLEAEIQSKSAESGIAVKLTEKSEKPRIDEAALLPLATKSEIIQRYLKFSETKKSHPAERGQ